MAPSVLLIGASGTMGKLVTSQFAAQRTDFAKVGILTDPEKAHKFEDAAKNGLHVVQGWYLDPAVYQGYDTVICLVGIPLMKLQPGIIEGNSSIPSKWQLY